MGKEFLSFNKASYLTLQKFRSVLITTSAIRGKSSYPSIRHPTKHYNTLGNQYLFRFPRELKWGKSSYPSIRHPTNYSNTLENQHIFLFPRELKDRSRKYHFSTPPCLLPGGRGKEFLSFNKASYLTLQKFGSVHSTMSAIRGEGVKSSYPSIRHLTKHSNMHENQHIFLFPRELRDRSRKYHFSTPPRLLPGGRGKE